MAKHSQQVPPQFGNWEGKEDVEYTTYFEKAVKGKKGNKTNNQNGPQEYYPDAEIKVTPRHSRHTSRDESEMRRPVGSPLHADVVNPKPVIGSHQQRQGGGGGGGGLRGSDMHRPRHHQRQVSREEGDMRRSLDNNNNNANQKSAQNSPYHRYGGGGETLTPKRGGVGSRQSVGSDRSIEHSPLHLHAQGKGGGGGGGGGGGRGSSSAMSSPSWERKGIPEGLAPSTPGRSRLRSVTKGDDTPDHGPAVPKFGDWDENDPSSAEGYTHIFNKVREEKQIGAGRGHSVPNDKTSYANGRKRITSGSSTGCGCFPWSR